MQIAIKASSLVDMRRHTDITDRKICGVVWWVGAGEAMRAFPGKSRSMVRSVEKNLVGHTSERDAPHQTLVHALP